MAFNKADVNSSNLMNESDHAGKKAIIESYNKRHGSAEGPKRMIKLYDGGSSFLDEIDEDQKVENISLKNFNQQDNGSRYTSNANYRQNEKLLDELML